MRVGSAVYIADCGDESAVVVEDDRSIVVHGHVAPSSHFKSAGDVIVLGWYCGSEQVMLAWVLLLVLVCMGRAYGHSLDKNYRSVLLVA